MHVKVEYLQCEGNLFTFGVTTCGYSQKFLFRFPKWFQFSHQDEPRLFLLVAPTVANLLAYQPTNSQLEITGIVQKDTQDAFVELVQLISNSISHLLDKPFQEVSISWNIRPIPKFNLLGRSSILIPKNTLAYFSGGSDSMLTHCLLRSLGEDPIPFTATRSSIAWNRGGQKLVEENAQNLNVKPIYVYNTVTHMKKITDAVISKTLNTVPENLKSIRFESYGDKNSFVHRLYGPVRTMTMLPMTAFIGSRFRVRNICPGEESHQLTEYLGQNIPDCANYEQHFQFHQIMSKMLSSCNWPMSVWNPAPNLSVSFTWLTLHRKYYPESKMISSCETAINRWCYRCEKCFFVYFLFQLLRIPPENYGFDPVKLANRHQWFHPPINLTNIAEDTSVFSPGGGEWAWSIMRMKHKKIHPIIDKFVRIQKWDNSDGAYDWEPILINDEIFIGVPIQHRENVKKLMSDIQTIGNKEMAKQ